MSSEIVRAESGWTRERVDLVKNTVCPRGIGDDEFALFAQQCQRSGLDPLLKEAFCVPRKVNTGTRERPVWGTKHEFQPSEAGMLTRAERFPDYGGIQASAVYAGDAIEMDAGAGSVSHKFNPAKRSGAIVGAWARVQRQGKVPVLVWVDFAAFVQQTPLWSKMPNTMLEKCARVAALRKAYPEAFSGAYIREEMPDSEFADPSPSPRKASVVVEATADQALQAIPIHTVKAAQAAVDKVLGRAPAKMGFGPRKNAPLSELAFDDLLQASEDAMEKISAAPSGSSWVPALRRNLAEIRAEIARRDGPPDQDPNNGAETDGELHGEPGSLG